MWFVCFMVFNVTFNNSSVISWQSVLLVAETGSCKSNYHTITVTTALQTHGYVIIDNLPKRKLRWSNLISWDPNINVSNKLFIILLNSKFQIWQLFYLDLTLFNWSIWSAISFAVSFSFLRRLAIWDSFWSVISSISRLSLINSCSRFLLRSIWACVAPPCSSSWTLISSNSLDSSERCFSA